MQTSLSRVGDLKEVVCRIILINFRLSLRVVFWITKAETLANKNIIPELKLYLSFLESNNFCRPLKNISMAGKYVYFKSLRTLCVGST